MDNDKILIGVLESSLDRLLTDIRNNENDIKSKVNENKSKEREIMVINEELNRLRGSIKPIIPAASIEGDDYDKDMPIKYKVVYAIKKLNRFLHITEIAQVMRDIESPGSDLSEFKNKVRQQLTPLKKEGIIAFFRPDNQLVHTFWGSPKWIVDGRIKEGYEYNEEFITKKDEIEI